MIFHLALAGSLPELARIPLFHPVLMPTLEIFARQWDTHPFVEIKFSLGDAEIFLAILAD